MQAVILASGDNSQLEPLTHTVAPPLILAEEEPVLHFLIRRLEAAGVNEILIATDAQAFDINSFIYAHGYRAWIQTVPTANWHGEAGSLKQLQHLLHGPFLVAQSHTLFDFDLKELISFHFRKQATMTVGTVLPASEESPGSDSSWLRGPVTELSNLALAGIYVMEPELLAAVPGGVPYGLTSDLIPRLISARASIHSFGMRGNFSPVNTLDGYLACQRWMLDMLHVQGFIHPGASVARGVELVPPFYVGAGSRVERDAVLGPYAVLAGPVTVGRGTKVVDSILYPGVRIGESAVVTGSVVGPGARLAERVIAEPGVIVGAEAQISSDTRLGSGSRVSPRTTLTPNPMPTPAAPSASTPGRTLREGVLHLSLSSRNIH